MKKDSEDTIELTNKTLLTTESGSAHAVIDLLESHGYRVEPNEFQMDESAESELEPIKGYFISLEE